MTDQLRPKPECARPMIGVVLRSWRDHQRLGIRDGAKTIGISHATLSRIENGKPTDGKTLLRLMAWLHGVGR
jgi:transcriptional regulator with XRE-family HTH domain